LHHCFCSPYCLDLLGTISDGQGIFAVPEKDIYVVGEWGISVVPEKGTFAVLEKETSSLLKMNFDASFSRNLGLYQTFLFVLQEMLIFVDALICYFGVHQHLLSFSAYVSARPRSPQNHLDGGGGGDDDAYAFSLSSPFSLPLFQQLQVIVSA
jgi:hypothetical protein